VAYDQHQREDKNDLMVTYEGEKYLASITSFPTNFGQNWQIAIIVPFLDYFHRVIQTQHHVVFISIAILLLTSLLTIYFSKRISKPIVILADEVNKIKQLNLDSNVRVFSHINEINLLDSSIAAMRSTIRSFSRYVPKEIVKKLVEMGQEIELGGEKREITLLFSDITGFTSFAEGMPLDALNVFLTEYFDGMSKTVLRNLGTIDKYIGDGMMAFWDAPDFLPDHAAKGCLAALECQEFVKEFNAKQKEKGLPELKTRIGLNTGEVIVGNVGTKERMNYTVIGDVVNGTERIQEMNKVFHTSIVIGEELEKRIGDRFVTRPLDIAELKGKKGKIQIYELLATKENVKPEERELAESFTKAYQLYHAGNLTESRTLFQDILQKFPNDYPTQLYLERIKQN
jgi:adenylate cyclase